MHDFPVHMDFSEGVDRKLLKRITDRFCRLNDIRLGRARSSLTWRQQTVLDLLPLVFHLNHPALPGYHTATCPYGLDRYQPSDRSVQTAQRLARSVRPDSGCKRAPDLTGVFLMGSPGSLGHSVASDLDVWLCHRPDLDTDGVASLEEKARRLSEWADSYGLELNIFVFSAEEFREGRQKVEVTAENCGSAQHHLLLDEFYRTAIHLGGRYPLWWLIPADQEGRYHELAAMLFGNRFIRPDEYLDFGAVPGIPVGEFLGAGVWQLYKGIDSPWKSILKLLLIECYARDREGGLLSASFKAQIHSGVSDADQLDPYVMLYERLAHWLGDLEAPGRLELVRQALYLKTGLPLTRAEEAAGRWQGQLLRRLVDDWGWERRILTELDNRHQWRAEKVLGLRRQMVAELTHSYRLLSKMARTEKVRAAISAADLDVLGRKLYAVFQRKAGKIEIINPGIAPSLVEENLSFWQRAGVSGDAGAHGWLLFRDLGSLTETPWQAPVRRASNLVELVLWCHCNGLLSRSTRLNLRQDPGGDASHWSQDGPVLTVKDLGAMAELFAAHLPVAVPVPRAALMTPARPLVHLLLVNVGVDPQASMTDRGLHKLSGQHDSLGFSGGRDNLVATVKQVTLNSWHEVSLQRYRTGDALAQCLKNLLAMQARAPEHMPEVRVWCASGSSHGPAIARRISELVADVCGQFFAGGAGPHPMRYLIQMDQRWFVLRFDGREPGFVGFASERELMGYLARPQEIYTPVVPDRRAMPGDPAFRAVCGACQPDVIQLFWHVAGARIRFWLTDETGSLYGWSQPFAGSRRQCVMPLLRFLVNLAERRQMREMAGGAAVPDIICTEVRTDEGQARLERIPVPADLLPVSWIELQAVGTQQGDGSIQFDLYCDEQAFTVEEYGDDQVAAAARYILGMRQGGERYPVYLTDLYLPHDLDPQLWQQDLQTCQYVWYRQQLQGALNRELGGS